MFFYVLDFLSMFFISNSLILCDTIIFHVYCTLYTV